MTALKPSLRSRLKALVQRSHTRLAPHVHRWERRLRTTARRLLRRPRTVSESPNLLPLLIQVLAAFSRVDGDLIEEEVDSILGFLRYDYPDAVYSDLRRHFRLALQEQHDLVSMAARLAEILSPEQKILLGVQLYDLISKAGLQRSQLKAYHAFMSKLGMAAQGIDIVYQLNASTESLVSLDRSGASPLEFLVFGPHTPPADVATASIATGESIRAYRYHDLILVKNQTTQRIYVRGRAVAPDGFCRIYPGHRIIWNEQVVTFEDLVFYFNAKKSVSMPQLYLGIDRGDAITLDRTRQLASMLEIRFGLSVRVRALRDAPAQIDGRRLKEGLMVSAPLDGKLVFDDGTEVFLSELRRRARAMGGRFTLTLNKSEYLVSNDPSRLGRDDILLSPGTSGDLLLKITCNHERRAGELEVLHANRPIRVGEDIVRNKAPLSDGDLIRIDSTQVLHCNFEEGIIEERRNIIRTLDVEDLRLTFPGGEAGLDGTTFSATRGEMICILGGSGSGKSTLLRTLAGQLPPDHGTIALNGIPLYPHLDALKGYLAHVPQENAFDEHLTIDENMACAAAIRSPHLAPRDRRRRVDAKLMELGLNERRDSLVGSVTHKTLSGGERKRLNIGLDMIGNADVYLIDEPTSGLSSKDSEHVLEIIRGLSHNKIVLVTIHQPSAKLFAMFQKALLLDRGGRMVFFGRPSEMLEYFARADHEHHAQGIINDTEVDPGDPRPESIFDVLETPLRDLGGEIIYEENQRGQLVPARRFSPDYWRDRFESYRLMSDVHHLPVRAPDAAKVAPPPAIRVPRVRLREEWVQFGTLLRRAFTGKLRNRANLLTTVVEAPLLAVLIGGVLRFSETGAYDFASSFHIPTYLFMALVVAMFLGLTNSADDIIRDRGTLMRERNFNVRMTYYVAAKALTLGFFAVLQCVLFLWIGNSLLEVRGMFLVYLLWMGMTALAGIAIGLLVSSLVSDAKTAVNIVPLILIPQIILGGALIKYEEMNRNLNFVHAIDRWFAGQPGESARPRSDLEVPWFSQGMPVRWSYEGLVVSQAKRNPLALRQDKVQARVTDLAARAAANPDDKGLAEAFEEAKDLLALLAGLEAGSPAEIDRFLQLVDSFLASPTTPVEAMKPRESGATAEQLYVNQKVLDLVSSAEIEQLDYRSPRHETGLPNVFFGPKKQVFGHGWNVQTVNAAVLNTGSLCILACVILVLNSQLRVHRKIPARPAYQR